MYFEMSSIINTYKSYQAIQLTDSEIEGLKQGTVIQVQIPFLEGAVINIQIGNSASSYPESWPKPNITSSDNADCPIPGCPDEKV